MLRTTYVSTTVVTAYPVLHSYKFQHFSAFAAPVELSMGQDGDDNSAACVASTTVYRDPFHVFTSNGICGLVGSTSYCELASCKDCNYSLSYCFHVALSS
uniref:Serine carboxypeptidase 3 n=1 Tax=Lygus hesperus TaxID=30085 RepID=A0A0A9WQ70_LYGHE